MLVLTGETSLERVPGAPHPPDLIFADIGAVADYLAANLPDDPTGIDSSRGHPFSRRTGHAYSRS